MDDNKPALHDELSTMISDLSHTGDLSMLYRMDIADTITALRVERDAAIELCGKAQDRWNEGIDERERLQSALIDMTTERDAAYARGVHDAAARHDGRNKDELALSCKYRSGTYPWFAHCQAAKEHREAAVAIRSLADAPPVPVVGVKPLVWHEGDEPGELKSGPYDVWCELGKFQCYYWSINLGGPHENADDAVAFLNAHHRALAALQPKTLEQALPATETNLTLDRK